MFDSPSSMLCKDFHETKQVKPHEVRQPVRNRPIILKSSVALCGKEAITTLSLDHPEFKCHIYPEKHTHTYWHTHTNRNTFLQLRTVDLLKQKNKKCLLHPSTKIAII